MINKLSRLFERHLQSADGVSSSLSLHQKQLATAALLIEVAMADHQFSESEENNLSHNLVKKFALTGDEVNLLIENAKAESNHATSLHQFTQLINQHCNIEEKFALITAMWEIAYSDEELHKYEDYTIRKIADLIYVSHSDFIRAKSAVKAKLSL